MLNVRLISPVISLLNFSSCNPKTKETSFKIPNLDNNFNYYLNFFCTGCDYSSNPGQEVYINASALQFSRFNV